MGAVAGLVGLVHGIVVQGRLAARIDRLGKEIQRSGQPASAEQLAQIQDLDAMLTKGENRGAVILAFSTIAMAAARYLY